MKVLGIDVGGSALKGAPVDTRAGRLLADRLRIEISADLPPEEVAARAGELTRHFRWRGPVGIGFPGVIEGNRILTAANLCKKFVGLQGSALFGRATGCPVAFINDAAAAALAEMKFGAGAGFMGKALMLTLGTGVGSALAIQGAVLPCELGHLPWRGQDAEKRVSAAVRERKDLSWEDWAARLNEYIAVLERILWPERIIIGGGVSAKHQKYFKFLRTRAPIVPAKLLNRAGIVGAALWGAGGHQQRARRTARAAKAFR